MSLFASIANSYVAAGGGGGSTYNDVISAISSLAARWKLDDTVDQTGGGDVAATVGTAGNIWGATPGVTGLVSDGGLAVSTNSGGWVELPMPTVTTAGSLIVWSAHGTGGSSGIPMLRDETSSSGWFFDISQTNPVWRINGTNHTVSTVTASTLRTGSRHMYVLTTTGTTVTFYIDGTQVDSWTKSASFSNWRNAVRLGVNGQATTQLYGGTFDDTAVFNAVISSTDVTNLWNAGK